MQPGGTFPECNYGHPLSCLLHRWLRFHALAPRKLFQDATGTIECLIEERSLDIDSQDINGQQILAGII